MIVLRNGRGALGSQLTKMICESYGNIHGGTRLSVEIYHTWNVDDKSRVTQAAELDKFNRFLSSRSADSRLVFVSTRSKSDDWYVHFKQRAEALLISSFDNAFVIRIPTIIGKGSLAGIRDGTLEPWGDYELVDVKCAANAILDLASYEGHRRVHELYGTTIPADLIRRLFTDVPIGKHDVSDRTF